MTDSKKLNENGAIANNASNVENVNVNDKDTNISNEVPTNSASSNDVNEKVKIIPLNPKDDDMNLGYLDKEFVYECMSVPTYSKKEYRMVAFIILWARRNKITYEFDNFGNIYLTKGELSEGEFYPCVTSHLDTVQDKQTPYIYAGVPLDLKTERTKDGTHKVSVDSNGGTAIGIGADDKSGICICLSMFDHIEKLKACFFLDEEEGCNGSDVLNVEWFQNVGYVIGFDSPDLYRAAWACSGTQLFSYNFYENYMKEVCDAWGLVKGCFFSEPYTDVKNIRQKTDIICMNFGNGGYLAHTTSEYIVIEDMDHACGMGIALIDSIGCTEHKLKSRNIYGTVQDSFRRRENGIYERVTSDDIPLLKELGDTKKTSYSTNYNSGQTSSYNSGQTSTSKDNTVKTETVKYIVNRYDSYISGIKDELLESIKALCVKQNIVFNDFENAINESFSNEIKF